MIASMTGFGRAMVSGPHGRVEVELRSVNSRFLDIQIRCPNVLQPFESTIRDCVQQKVTRGKISVHINLFEIESNNPLPVLDKRVVNRYVEEFKRLEEICGTSREIDLELIMRLPGVFTTETVDIKNDNLEKMILEALDSAVADLIEMRSREGVKLATDARERLNRVNSLLADIETELPLVRRHISERLRERIDGLIRPDELDEGRLTMEIALIAERSDITEEIVRFTSHNQQFEEALDEGGEVGRRLNFLLQEMNREANTINSKIANTKIVHVVLEIKEEVERLREQIQNLA